MTGRPPAIASPFWMKSKEEALSLLIPISLLWKHLRSSSCIPLWMPMHRHFQNCTVNAEQGHTANAIAVYCKSLQVQLQKRQQCGAKGGDTNSYCCSNRKKLSLFLRNIRNIVRSQSFGLTGNTSKKLPTTKLKINVNHYFHWSGKATARDSPDSARYCEWNARRMALRMQLQAEQCNS